jgi:hypothetical protein
MKQHVGFVCSIASVDFGVQNGHVADILYPGYGKGPP